MGLGIVDEPAHEVHLADVHILDPQLVEELPLGRPPDPHYVLALHLLGSEVRVAAAGVGPRVGECDLGGGALLQQELAGRVEDEHAEGTVEDN